MGVMGTRFKSSRVQRFKVLGIGFVLTLELLNPLNLERASGQTPFYQGKTVRIKNAMRLVSPIRYRNQASVSVDGGPFVNYGNPWFEKDLGGNPGRQ